MNSKIPLNDGTRPEPTPSTLIGYDAAIPRWLQIAYIIALISLIAFAFLAFMLDVSDRTPQVAFSPQNVIVTPCACWCVALPLVASNQPTATITPYATITPTPTYTNNVLLLNPSQSVIAVSETVTIDVYVKARLQAIELRLYVSPTILAIGEVTGTLPCDITSIKTQPGVIAYDCELSQEYAIDGNILQLSFTGAMTGTARIEPYANGAFVGFENGAAMWLAGEGAEVEVR
jgi:hypothetical protein